MAWAESATQSSLGGDGGTSHCSPLWAGNATLLSPALKLQNRKEERQRASSRVTPIARPGVPPQLPSPLHPLHQVSHQLVRDAGAGLLSQAEGILQLLQSPHAPAALPVLLLELRADHRAPGQGSRRRLRRLTPVTCIWGPHHGPSTIKPGWLGPTRGCPSQSLRSWFSTGVSLPPPMLWQTQLTTGLPPNCE